MSNPRKRPKSLESMKEHSADGTKMAQSRPSEPPLGNDDTTLSDILLPNQAVTNAKSLSMPELVATPSSQTSTDRWPHCPTSTPKQKSSQKSEAGSTSRERKCWPDWDIICQEMSAWLSLPIKTDWQYGDLTCFDGSVSKTGAHSWFSTRQVSVQNQKWLRTSSPSSTALAPDYTDGVNTKLRSKKIRIYPSPELNQVWRKWLAACRYCYNQAIALSRSGKRLSKLKLRCGSDAE
ncbi:Helix-turn-helix domain-containing protein [Limnospira platensis C1]|nr:Helix-turn-helix domain-containing protein [Arthrospira platensis C1]